MPESGVLLLHLIACALLALFGVHRVWLLAEFLRDRRKRAEGARPEGTSPAPFSLEGDLPFVTVQLPLYNERTVCERLVDAVCALDYPRDRLEIQVLDDSTDDTTEVVTACVRRWRDRGVDIHHVRRAERVGFKAGALAHGLAIARGELVAIFDADFVPRPDFLRATVPAFVDPGVGMVQARWGHLNRDESWLTSAQAIFLDGHFTIEHAVRAARGRFFNFNGTAGIWRRSAIERAGGWDAATLTEDLDLSFRAQLAGSRFRYLDHVEVPAELPSDVNAFKGQQHRWAKGSVQTARRLLGAVWRADLPLLVRLDATLKLTQNLAFLLLAFVVVTMPVAALVRAFGDTPWVLFGDAGTLGLATLPVACHFLLAQAARGRPFGRSLLALPIAIGLGGALSLNNARAVLEGLFGTGTQVFVRTPKRGEGARTGYPTRLHPLALVELLVGALHLGTAALLAATGRAGATPFLWLFGASLIALALGSLVAPLRLRLAIAR